MRFRSVQLLWATLTFSALVIAGCAAGARSAASARATPRATATAAPLPSLTWTLVKLPTSFTATGENLSISPVDGHDAWMCQSTSANTYVIWKTTDAGQSWRQTGHFSYTAPMAGASCGLSADQNGTSALLATISWGLWRMRQPGRRQSLLSGWRHPLEATVRVCPEFRVRVGSGRIHRYRQ